MWIFLVKFMFMEFINDHDKIMSVQLRLTHQRLVCCAGPTLEFAIPKFNVNVGLKSLWAKSVSIPYD